MQTIGERLEEARKKKGVSIREAAEATKIRGDYLQKFESNHFDIGLTEIYTRGFLRTYANYLKVPSDRILSDYASLGRGDVRPRQPSREVYGRMDISVASAAEPAERGGASSEPPPEAAASARQQPRSRGATSLPSGPDPALVFKYVKWGGVAVIVIVALFVIKALFSGGSSAAPSAKAPSTPPPASAPATETITLVALDTVFVRVNERVGETEGAELFSGTLRRGETHAVPWNGPLFLSASAGELLKIEVRGNRYDSAFRGNGRAKIDPPRR